MASLVTKTELQAKLKDLQTAYDSMNEDSLACPVCFNVFRDEDLKSGRRSKTCWCDYDSPLYDYGSGGYDG
jgi:uncharacterized protein (DUF2225 family)